VAGRGAGARAGRREGAGGAVHVLGTRGLLGRPSGLVSERRPGGAGQARRRGPGERPRLSGAAFDHRSLTGRGGEPHRAGRQLPCGRCSRSQAEAAGLAHRSRALERGAGRPRRRAHAHGGRGRGDGLSRAVRGRGARGVHVGDDRRRRPVARHRGGGDGSPDDLARGHADAGAGSAERAVVPAANRPRGAPWSGEDALLPPGCERRGGREGGRARSREGLDPARSGLDPR